MHNRNSRAAVSGPNTDDPRIFAPRRSDLASRLLRLLTRRPAEAAGWVVVLALIALVVVNALFRQEGRHPAPMLGARVVSDAAPVAGESTGSLIAMPRPRPAEPAGAAAEPAAAARPRAQLMLEMQRELARRGFYDGPADGIYGPKMDAAIRDFEQAAGLRSAGEPSEALLQSIIAAPIKPKPGRRAEAGHAAAASSARVLAVQRALAEFGFGPIKLTGSPDEATRQAVEKFERERKLPTSGQITDRLMRELAAVTGRPLE